MSEVTTTTVTVATMLEVRIPDGVALSPDGSQVAFCVAESDTEDSRWVSRLWIADCAGGDARQITFSYEGERCPRWSPDGRYLAFLSARPDMTEPASAAEDEPDQPKEQLWVLPSRGGEAYRLTKERDGILEFEWLHDASALIYLASESDPLHLRDTVDSLRKARFDGVVAGENLRAKLFWSVTPVDPKPELLFTGDPGIAEFDIDPRGERIVYSSNGTGDPNDYHLFDLFTLNLSDGQVAHITDRRGGEHQPRWSPDGTRIAFIAGRDTQHSFSQDCLWSVACDGHDMVNHTEGMDEDIHAYKWMPTGEGMVTMVADGVAEPLIHLRDGDAQLLTDPIAPLECTDFDWVAGVCVAVLEDARTLPEVYVLGPGGARRPITDLNGAVQRRTSWPRQELVRWTSDGQVIEGLVTYPAASAGPGPWPLCLQIHGGPHGRSTCSLRGYHMPAVWASAGYVVFRPNYRGSEGYGNAFATSSYMDLGGGDYRDIMAGVERLIELGVVDHRRMGVLGGSYGGYMTNWIISQCNRFRGAVSLFGVFDLTSDYGNSEIARWETDYLCGHYWEDDSLYRERSPSTFVQQIRTPLLIIHGEADTNTAISNSQALMRALKDRGAVVEFVRYPREGHGLAEPNHKSDEMRRCLAWFDRYVRDSADTAPRLGDEVVHEDLRLRVTAVSEIEDELPDRGDRRWIQIAAVVAGVGAYEAGWHMPLSDFALADSQGAVWPLLGVVNGQGDCRSILSGRDLVLAVPVDSATAQVSFAVSLAFEVPRDGGRMALRLGELPSVTIDLNPMESPKE